MMIPAITTIIPAWNPDPDLLVGAVESALGAGASDVLVVFDHEFREAAQHAARLRSRLPSGWQQVCTGKNGLGASHARNQGVLMARTPVVSFLDADDAYRGPVLDQAAAIFGSTPAEAVYLATTCMHWPSRDEICSYAMPEGWATEEAFAAMHHPTLPIVRADIARLVRFNADVRFSEDTLFNAAIIQRGRAWSYPVVGYEYRVLAKSQSHRGFDPDFHNAIDQSYAEIIAHPSAPMKAMFRRKREINRDYFSFLQSLQDQGKPFVDYHTWMTTVRDSDAA